MIPPTTYPDEHIDYWGEVYVANPRLARRGVLFETFVVAPQDILWAVISTPDPPAVEPSRAARRMRSSLDLHRAMEAQLALALDGVDQLLRDPHYTVHNGAVIYRLPCPRHHRRKPSTYFRGGAAADEPVLPSNTLAIERLREIATPIPKGEDRQ